MAYDQSISTTITSQLREKVSDYVSLFKLRLSSMVVFSALAGYLIATGGVVTWIEMFMLSIGGMAVTGASNAINQILERDIDKLMERTKNRPLPTKRMTKIEATIVAGITGLFGILILSLYFNTLAGLLAAASLLMYAFVYTPLKRISPIAVLVGAIPGALPPLIGYVCIAGTVNEFILIVFLLQFIWQFPHFWSIAWVAHDDYKKANINLLPYSYGPSKQNALLNIIYILILLPVIVLPFIMQDVGLIATIILIVSTILFLIPAIKLFIKCDTKSAKMLMFSSFIYLPVILMALTIGKI